MLVTDPWAAMRQRIEETGQRTDLPAEERLMLLREFETDLTSLLGLVGQYRGDAFLEQEAREPTMQEAIMLLREEAAIRGELVEADPSFAVEMDAAGVLSLSDIDDLAEEGLLEAWVEESFADIVYDEAKHPRGRHGEFSDVLGRAIKPKGRKGKRAAAPKTPAAPKAPHDPKVETPATPAAPKAPKLSPGAPSPTGTGAADGDWIDVGDDIAKAAQLLGEGKRVRLDQPRQVSTLLSHLAKVSQEMIEKGEKAPNYDLCKVSVKGTNLFCAQSKGIERVKMPQLGGTPVPGSKADALPKDANGRVDLTDQFREHLASMGVKITAEQEKASYLRASQHELNGVKVAKIAEQIESGKRKQDNPLFISREGYIVDGHHRWAATVGVDLKDNKAGDLDMGVERVDMDIGSLLAEAIHFTKDWGVANQDVSDGTDAALAEAKAAGLNGKAEKGAVAKALLGDFVDTKDLHSVHLSGEPKEDDPYTPERQALHDLIIDTLLRQRKPVVNDKGETVLHPDPNGEYLPKADGTPRALFMAGGPASGKTTALGLPENQDILPPGAVFVDPDEIKSMLPEYNKMVRGYDRYSGTGAHEESSDLAKRLQKEALAKGLHAVIDGAGNSGSGKYAGKIKAVKDAGYDPEVLYVNAPVNVALDRAVSRAQQSGRWMPEDAVREYHQGVSKVFPEVRKLVEDGTVSKIKMYDTGGGQGAQLMAHGGNGSFNVTDSGLFDAFMAKAQTK